MINIGREVIAREKSFPELCERTRLATESIDEVFSAIPSYIVNVLPDVSRAYDQSVNYFNGLLETNVFSKALLEMKPDIEKLKKVDYHNVMDLRVPVMLGMKKPLLETAMVIKEASINIDENLLNMLNTTDLIVSDFISSEKFRTSVTPYDARQDIYKNTNTLSKLIDSIIDPNGVVDQMKLSTLSPNINNIVQSYTVLTELTKNKNLSNVKHVQNMITAISKKVDGLHHLLKTDKNIVVSNSKLAFVSDVITDTARYVSLSASFWHIANQTMTITKYIVDNASNVK